MNNAEYIMELRRVLRDVAVNLIGCDLQPQEASALVTRINNVLDLGTQVVVDGEEANAEE